LGNKEQAEDLRDGLLTMLEIMEKVDKLLP
jgi:hypothetical protein